VLAHLDTLRESGFDVDLSFQAASPSKLVRMPARLAELVADAWGPLSAELLFIQRRTYPPLFARRLRRSGVPLVFDFDDALYLPPPRASQDERTRTRYRRNFLATVTAADLALCGNRELASQVPHGRTATLPTPVDCELFRPESVKPSADPVVGWVGHADNLPFLEALADPLREVARRHPGFRLVVAADRPPKIDGVRVEFRPWKLEDEVRCFDGIRVGLMPLDDTPWTRGKCAFKALQYMALGIPPVVSPVGMNREVVLDGDNGFVAAHAEEWVRSIDTLLSDIAMAHRLAVAARKMVESEFSLTATSRRLVAMLEGLHA
jgi:glycosyltransferase involved in cell wall biosynthesis